MSGLRRVGAEVWRGAARLAPAGRRDWVEAVWAEAPEVPPGLRRLAWRAGGVRLIAREAQMRRGIGSAMLLAAAAVAAWVAWPGSSASFATPVDRVYVVTMVLLAGLPLLARPFLGPTGDSRAARFLRVGTCAALLALIPATVAVEQFLYTPPRGGADLRVYLLIGPAAHALWRAEIFLLVIMALYAAAIFWMTSRRSRVAPGTLAIGTGAGIALGLVMYAVAPFGLSKAATNPWLPGSDIDPLVLLAWLLLLGAPVVAAVVAECVALSRSDDAAAGRGDPRRGGGSPPGPEPGPDPPAGGQLAGATDDDAGLAAGLPGLREPDPGIEQDLADLADAAVLR